MNENENPRCVHVTFRIPVCSKSGLLKRKDGDHLGINGVVDLSRSRRSRSLSFKMVIVSLKSWRVLSCCHFNFVNLLVPFRIQTHMCFVVHFIFHFARYLRTTKVLNLCFLFDFERSWNIEAFSRSMLFVMIFTTAPRVGCKLRASAQRKRRQVIARCFAKSVSPRLKDHRRSQRKRRHWRSWKVKSKKMVRLKKIETVETCYGCYDSRACLPNSQIMKSHMVAR